MEQRITDVHVALECKIMAEEDSWSGLNQVRERVQKRTKLIGRGQEWSETGNLRDSARTVRKVKWSKEGCSSVWTKKRINLSSVLKL